MNVTDPTGAAIPGATVLIAPESFPKKLETDEKGALSLPLPVGSYEITVSMPNFVSATRRLVVIAEKDERMTIALNVGGCPPGPCVEVVPEVDTPDEQAVWKLEHDYWNYVKAFDLEGYRTLWHKDFTGWPYMSASPVHKDHITDWITAYKNKGQHIESFDLEPAASRANPNGVVTFYIITEHVVDKNGKSETSKTRITHTWIKSGNSWQIISGMSSAISDK